MKSHPETYPGKTYRGPLPVLHLAFALTGVLHAIGGALLPALAASLGFTDSRSGTLFLCYFLGTSLGALFSVGRLVRMIVCGFLVSAAACAAIAAGLPALLPALFLLLGIGVGMPMTAISMYAGRVYADRSAAPLTLLNFAWSAGALVAPLFASRILVAHSWHTAYGLLAIVSAIAAVACGLMLKEPAEDTHAPQKTTAPREITAATRYGVIALFAFLTFLEVGIENTTATWLASYAMRIAGTGAARAAAFSSFYWCGFLASRGLSAIVLLRVPPMRVLLISVVASLLAAVLLVSSAAAPIAMAALGMMLAPIFPLLLSRFFARAAHISDSRWVLAVCGFGGSVLPWLTGLISSRTNSLRLGLWVVPAALLLMFTMLPFMQQKNQPSL
jgi:fucose permease